MNYTVRLDILSPEDGPKLIKFLEKYDKYLVYDEISDKKKKPHYQGIIWYKDEKEAKAAKTRYTEMFGKTHPKSLKSMIKVNTDNYEIYITKGGKVFCSKDYTEDKILELQTKSYKKPTKKTTQKSQFSKILDYCKESNLQCTANGWEIAALILKYYTHEVKCEPNDFQIKCMAKSIQRQLCYEYSQESGKNVFNNYIQQRAKDIIGHEWIHVNL